MNKIFELRNKIDYCEIMIAREQDPFPSNYPHIVEILKKQLKELLDHCDHTDSNENTVLTKSKTLNQDSIFCKLCQRHFNPVSLSLLEESNKYLR